MVTLQSAPKYEGKIENEYDFVNHFFVTVPKSLVISKNYHGGDEIGFFIVGGEIVPQQGDILLRKVR